MILRFGLASACIVPVCRGLTRIRYHRDNDGWRDNRDSRCRFAGSVVPTRMNMATGDRITIMGASGGRDTVPTPLLTPMVSGSVQPDSSTRQVRGYGVYVERPVVFFD